LWPVAGEADAKLSALITRYARLVRSVVARVAGRRDPDLGDDVTQRVAEALWKQVRSEQEIRHPASYIYRCAVRETIRMLSGEPEEPLPEAGAADEPAATAADPEQQARAFQLARATEQALAEMTPERAAAARAHLAGFDVDEIMQMHGWSYQKARNLVARAMADLRARLAELGYP
jgi:RNA polymerase sigma factor (sigma-70 family)